MMQVQVATFTIAPTTNAVTACDEINTHPEVSSGKARATKARPGKTGQLMRNTIAEAVMIIAPAVDATSRQIVMAISCRIICQGDSMLVRFTVYRAPKWSGHLTLALSRANPYAKE